MLLLPLALLAIETAFPPRASSKNPYSGLCYNLSQPQSADLTFDALKLVTVLVLFGQFQESTMLGMSELLLGLFSIYWLATLIYNGPPPPTKIDVVPEDYMDEAGILSFWSLNASAPENIVKSVLQQYIGILNVDKLVAIQEGELVKPVVGQRMDDRCL